MSPSLSRSKGPRDAPAERLASSTVSVDLRGRIAAGFPRLVARRTGRADWSGDANGTRSEREVSLMRGSALGPLAAVALVTGVLTGLGGCALPHALPVEGGTTSTGPSPYGVW